jgi:holo-[acyl-carrier protein] synthase
MVNAEHATGYAMAARLALSYNRGMPYAIGVDAVELSRVQRVLDRHGERFLNRVYTPVEVAFCRGRLPELAARFAAKEATMKALGTGAGLAWREIEILPNRRGKPMVFLHGKAAERGRAIGMQDIDVSLTHSRELAIAIVVGFSSEEIDRSAARSALIEWLRERGLL